MEFIQTLVANFRWQDLVDIILVWMIIYRLLPVLKGTRALQILTGLAIVASIFFLSEALQLYSLNAILSQFFDYLFLIIVILFQEDIRKALSHIGKTPSFLGATRVEEVQVIDELVQACAIMASRHVGALIVIEREMALKGYLETGTVVDSKLSQGLLISIFNPRSPLHDGAVVIQNGRVNAAACVLPLTRNPNIDPALGTRHRAALGLTEETDAVVLVVSEERGEVSLVQGGQITRNLDSKMLRNVLLRYFDVADDMKTPRPS